ncbi:hypothetical protein J6590_077163 [Homalodisca vitripennis]|nr:hypothetical protein J6590_077163 [Homalodisca vitripennis]
MEHRSGVPKMLTRKTPILWRHICGTSSSGRIFLPRASRTHRQEERVVASEATDTYTMQPTVEGTGPHTTRARTPLESTELRESSEEHGSERWRMFPFLTKPLPPPRGYSGYRKITESSNVERGCCLDGRFCPCKQPTCPAVGGGSEITFKPLVPRLNVRVGFLALTSPVHPSEASRSLGQPQIDAVLFWFRPPPITRAKPILYRIFSDDLNSL